mmetsp:Transcript_41406/g.107164  ORF Transcript_41406/g.107164 Transcript_41406/m.107164 type:complete len:95 (+) Transcript_41406:236-520(+)
MMLQLCRGRRARLAARDAQQQPLDFFFVLLAFLLFLLTEVARVVADVTGAATEVTGAMGATGSTGAGADTMVGIEADVIEVCGYETMEGADGRL